jgi:type I restriction enzyme M protein
MSTAASSQAPSDGELRPQSERPLVFNQTFNDIEKFEADLWEAADNLRANSKLTSSDYFMPVLGVIFLRHAANRFEAAARQIEQDQTAGRMPKRKIVPADFVRRRALWIPPNARYDWLMQQAATSGTDLPTLVTKAMTAIEDSFEPLKGVLPKDYGIFEPTVLEDLMRLFNSEQIKSATGDVFGRIYEYFLAKFSIQKAHDNGEFFTPSSLVQMIVNVIEPDHGVVFDPACGSGGMFVQSSHFIEHEGGDTAKKVVFYGQEKNPDTIHIALMNLAVHGLVGKIANAITYYQDEHNLGPKEPMAPGRCDFVMANPPFNVDLVDAGRIKGDARLPFGLPGITKGTGKRKDGNGNAGKQSNRVSNGNYLWISYFWSYLNEKGRAGFVMSSQASSAGHGEKEVRKKLIETDDVDVMIAIRSNFFYTRPVPCELWHLDRGKPPERRNKVLMLDARKIFRKVTRTICDFSPEQMKNLSAIVWLYRSQQDRFLRLIREYFADVRRETDAISGIVGRFEKALAEISARFSAFNEVVKSCPEVEEGHRQVFAGTIGELSESLKLYEPDRAKLLAGLTEFVQTYGTAPLDKNDSQHAARKAFDPLAEEIRGLTKQVDLLYKLTTRVAEHAARLTTHDGISAAYDRRGTAKLLKQLDEYRKDAAEQLRQSAYFHRQIAWLQDRFPNAELQAVAGLVKVVDKKEIEAADWNVSPGRHVGVAPPEIDEDFDFEQTVHDIRVELQDLNSEATKLAAQIDQGFEEIGA